MEHYKILVTGPFAAGKTSFISTISEIEPVLTEVPLTDLEEAKIKDKTTIALDFGRITIDEKNVLHVFGTPGQFRFNYMWSILSTGALGVVVIIDGEDFESFEDAKDMINFFRIKSHAPLLVAVNRKNGIKVKPVEEIKRDLNLPFSIPAVDFNAFEKESVKSVLMHLFNLILMELNK